MDEKSFLELRMEIISMKFYLVATTCKPLDEIKSDLLSFTRVAFESLKAAERLDVTISKLEQNAKEETFN